MQDTHRRFDDVLEALEQERQRVDEDFRRLMVAAAYLRTLLSSVVACGDGVVLLGDDSLGNGATPQCFLRGYRRSNR